MRNPSRSSLVPLPAAELAVLAAGSELPPRLRDSVVASIAGRPEVLAELRAFAASVPAQASTRDPFVNALRRLCWPDERVSLLHRYALATVTEPLGMLHLVAEEARTLAFRHLSVSGLAAFHKWLSEWINKTNRTRSKTMIELRVFGALFFLSVYTEFLSGNGAEPKVIQDAAKLMQVLTRLVATIETSDRQGKKSKEASDVVAPIWGQAGFEGTLAMMLLLGSAGRPEKVYGDVEDEEPTGDERVLIEITRSWMNGLAKGDGAAAHFHLHQALAALDEQCDPWLELLVRLNAALACEAQVHSKVPGFKARLEAMVPKMPMVLGDPFAELFLGFRNDCALQEEVFKPGIDHLMAAETLLREFATPKLSTMYLEVQAKLLVAKDPARAMEALLDAIVSARELDDDGARAEHLMVEALVYKAGLSRMYEGEPRVKAVLKRYEAEVAEELMKIWSFYEGFPGLSVPAKYAGARQKFERNRRK